MKYITETAPMPLMRINYYIYAEDEKLVQELGRGLLSKALWLGLCVLISKDSRNIN